MTARRFLLTVAVAAATCAYLIAAARGWAEATYAAKPLIALACLGLAVSGAAPVRTWVIAGLLFSLGGDVALMLPGDYFVPGLALFLIAHLCYVRAFTVDGWRVTPVPSLAVGAYLMLAVTTLLPYLGPMRAPVAIYALVISAVAWQALERAAALRTPSAWLVAGGAVFFAISDTTLAVNRFVTHVTGERVLIMTTYAAAQWAIATGMSARRRER